MASIEQLLAESLERLHSLQQQNPNLVIKGTEQLPRVHLNRLLVNGWLTEVMKGWYIPSRPGSEGDTTVWYTSYWHFVKAYLQSRYGDNWVIMPDQSLDIISGKTTVPEQLIIKSPKAGNTIVNLPFGHSILPLRGDLPQDKYIEPAYGLNLYTLENALIFASPIYFKREEISARICLSLIKDSTELQRLLVEPGATTRAGRIAGAFRNNGQNSIADEVLKMMRDFGYKVVETDPFDTISKVSFRPDISPYAARIRQMWGNMREQVIENFPLLPSDTEDIDSYIANVDEKYLEDAYHSLSIEGYQVTKQLIDNVRSGKWKPDDEDKDHKRALVARGYYQAFNAVKESIIEILKGKNSGEVVEEEHGSWYRQMWMPFVTVGILRPTDLIGYRRSQVYIRGSKHIPLNPEAVSDAMAVLFDLLKSEPDARVRAVLGHFIFVFIHPYMDGNGRMARFLLNTMLASGGYAWTIVPLHRRDEYMKALEKASVDGDITDFTRIICELVKNQDASCGIPK
ncbi:MAG: cell filamentation protein Fic [Bacteroidales bacterium]|nr:cell filamentation protein Fic [Bacteroidales bacterium]